MKCLTHHMCTTCTLAGLIRCPALGVPLPLVENEKTKVVYRSGAYLTVVRRIAVGPGGGGGGGSARSIVWPNPKDCS